MGIKIETVPTIIRFDKDGKESARIEDSEEWADFLQIEIPETMLRYKPGYGSTLWCQDVRKTYWRSMVAGNQVSEIFGWRAGGRNRSVLLSRMV